MLSGPCWCVCRTVRNLTLVTLASSISALPDDGDYCETRWSCSNVNSNVNSKLPLVICNFASVGEKTLTEVFLCFFLSCNANARVKLTQTGHGPHCSTLVVICVVLLLFVLFYISFVCKCVLPPADNPIAANKYIIIININNSQKESAELTL